MAKYKKQLDDDIRCPLEYGLTLFGGKWKSRIICVLSVNERLCYSEIRKEMYNITCCSGSIIEGTDGKGNYCPEIVR